MATRMAPPDLASETERLEVDLLLEGIFRLYGYDLREYDDRFILRVVRRRVEAEHLKTVSQLLDRILRDPEALNALLESVSAAPSRLFMPVRFWRSLRRNVIPHLRTYPSVRAWTVGSPGGSDVYAVSILFKEELGRTSRIYSTQLHEGPPGGIRKRRFTRPELQKSGTRYRSAGGSQNLSSYFNWDGEEGRLSPDLERHVVFGSHNLATDSAFNDFHLILARDVMAGFNDELRARSHRLLHQSLIRLGFLALGNGEALDRSPHASCYRAVDADSGIYQKVAE